MTNLKDLGVVRVTVTGGSTKYGVALLVPHSQLLGFASAEGE